MAAFNKHQVLTALRMKNKWGHLLDQRPRAKNPSVHQGNSEGSGQLHKVVIYLIASFSISITFCVHSLPLFKHIFHSWWACLLCHHKPLCKHYPRAAPSSEKKIAHRFELLARKRPIYLYSEPGVSPPPHLTCILFICIQQKYLSFAQFAEVTSGSEQVIWQVLRKGCG